MLNKGQSQNPVVRFLIDVTGILGCVVCSAIAVTAVLVPSWPGIIAAVFGSLALGAGLFVLASWAIHLEESELPKMANQVAGKIFTGVVRAVPTRFRASPPRPREPDASEHHESIHDASSRS